MNDEFTRGMGFVPPLPITLDNMSTNVAASGLQPWSASKAYALNDEIIDTSRVIWRSMVGSNTGNDPASSEGKWQRRGVENRLRMFDASLGSYTEADDLIEVTIKPGRVVTDIELLGLQAHTVEVVMTDPVAGEVFHSGQRLVLRPSGNSHWGYFFNPIERERKLSISGLPAYTQWRPSVSFDDWSLKKRDDWGGWMAEPGAYSDRLKLQVLVHGTQYERVRNEILAYRARPVVWIGARGYGVLTTYGYITGFDQVLVAHGFSDCNLTIEGLEDDELHTPT